MPRTPDDSRLHDLQARIDTLKEKQAKEAGPTEPTKDATAMANGVKAGTELLGPIIGSALLGYGLDSWLGTRPWLLIIMLILGVGAGFLSLWKTLQNQ